MPAPERNPDAASGVYPPMNTRTALPPDAPPLTGGGRAPSRPPDGAPPADLPRERPDGVPPPLPNAAQAFSDFYRTHWPAVARGLALTLGNHDLGAEAADEAMARAYAQWSTVQTYDNPAGWVYRVGLNWARSHRRRLARLMPFTGSDAAAVDAVDDPAVRRALLELDLKHRSVVVCRLLLDWSVEQTAAVLDLSPGTVKSRLHRALHILAPALRPEGDPR
jgi:DNA-directed RNA polymerase specialized sigma24 family protein